MANPYLQIDPKDNIIVAIHNLDKGKEIEIAGQQITLKEDIQAKHKFALKDIAVGSDIIMYGVLVGKAMQPIPRGKAITRTNTKHAAAGFKENTQHFHWQAPAITAFKNRTFKGYHRKDGSVGTANYWLVIPLVFCENRNVEVLESALCEALGYQTKKDFAVDTLSLVQKYKAGAQPEDILNTSIVTTAEEMTKNRVFPNVDGIKFLKHDGGCGGIRQDSEVLCQLLAGYITHANVAGATILSLGCQNAQIDLLQKSIQQKDPHFSKPIFYLVF